MQEDRPIREKLQMLKHQYLLGKIDHEAFRIEIKRVCSGLKETIERRRIVKDLEKAIDENNLAKVKEVIEKNFFYCLKDRRVDCCSKTLIKAAQLGRIEIVERLLWEKPDIDIQDIDGKTPLIHASENGHTEVAAMLMDSEADINIRDKAGKIAHIYAAENGHLGVLQTLRNTGVGISNEDKQAALDAAHRNGFTECEEFLKNIRVPKTKMEHDFLLWSSFAIRRILETRRRINC